MNSPQSPPLPPWQTSLDFASQSEDHYRDFWNQPLMDMVPGAPRCALELGCAGGMFGAKLKERYPGARVVGVEAGKAAAAKAATRLDRVLHARLEELDLEAAGFAAGEFDMVIAADILEHLVNPWKFLVDLRRFLAADAVVLASIPNARNIGLVLDLLVNGRWRYQERGLLDITHVRFFTLQEMGLMFQETGYRVERYDGVLSPSLTDMWRQFQGKESVNLSNGRFTLANVTRAELSEFCTEQFLLVCRPA